MRRGLKSSSRPITSSAVSTLLTTAWRRPSASRRAMWVCGGTRVRTQQSPCRSTLATTQSPTAIPMPCASISPTKRVGRRAVSSPLPSCSWTVLRWISTSRIRRPVSASEAVKAAASAARAGVRPSERKRSKSISIMVMKSLALRFDDDAGRGPASARWRAHARPDLEGGNVSRARSGAESRTTGPSIQLGRGLASVRQRLDQGIRARRDAGDRRTRREVALPAAHAAADE